METEAIQLQLQAGSNDWKRFRPSRQNFAQFTQNERALDLLDYYSAVYGIPAQKRAMDGTRKSMIQAKRAATLANNLSDSMDPTFMQASFNAVSAAVTALESAGVNGFNFHKQTGKIYLGTKSNMSAIKKQNPSLLFHPAWNVINNWNKFAGSSSGYNNVFIGKYGGNYQAYTDRRDANMAKNVFKRAIEYNRNPTEYVRKRDEALSNNKKRLEARLNDSMNKISDAAKILFG